MEKDKQKYEPPKAMRLDDEQLGKGDCEANGSGDTQCVTNGNSAGDLCFENGSSALGCFFEGNSAS